MASRGAEVEDGELITGINVTPLVDVVLVLLVVLMVTASFLARQLISVDVPPARPDEASALEPAIAVTVDAHGAMFVDDRRVDDAELTQLALAAAAGRSDARGTVAGDADGRYGDVVHAMDVLRRAGLTGLAIHVRDIDVARP